jgi:hypothetical protein
LCGFVSKATCAHMEDAETCLRYLHHTIDSGLILEAMT